MITKNELCWMVVNEFCNDIDITLQECAGYIGQSSQLAVAMLELGLLQDKMQIEYAQSRAGIMLSGNCSPYNQTPGEFKVLSLVDILLCLPN